MKTYKGTIMFKRENKGPRGNPININIRTVDSRSVLNKEIFIIRAKEEVRGVIKGGGGSKRKGGGNLREEEGRRERPSFSAFNKPGMRITVEE